MERKEKIEILLDTNILIYLSQKDKTVIDFINKNDFNYGISIITYMEFLLGFDYSSYAVNFLDKFGLLDITQKEADIVLEIFSVKKIFSLRNNKMADCLIAATAISNSVPLVTNNEKDFKMIPNLEIINPFNIK